MDEALTFIHMYTIMCNVLDQVVYLKCEYVRSRFSSKGYDHIDRVIELIDRLATFPGLYMHKLRT